MNKKQTAHFPFYKVHEVSVYHSTAQNNHHTSCTNHRKKDKEPTHYSGLCPQKTFYLAISLAIIYSTQKR